MLSACKYQSLFIHNSSQDEGKWDQVIADLLPMKRSSAPLLKIMFSINWWHDQNTINFMLESQRALADRMGIYLEE
ncbi:hypothetical protein [Pseudomonas graminis]